MLRIWLVNLLLAATILVYSDACKSSSGKGGGGGGSSSGGVVVNAQTYYNKKKQVNAVKKVLKVLSKGSYTAGDLDGVSVTELVTSMKEMGVTCTEGSNKKYTCLKSDGSVDSFTEVINAVVTITSCGCGDSSETSSSTITTSATDAGISCADNSQLDEFVCIDQVTVVEETTVKETLRSDVTVLYKAFQKKKGGAKITFADLQDITVEELVQSCYNLGVSCSESGGVWTCTDSEYGYLITFLQQATLEAQGKTVTFTVTEEQITSAAGAADVTCSGGVCEVTVVTVEESKAQLGTDTTTLIKAFKKYKETNTITSTDLEGITVESLVATCENLGVTCTDDGKGNFDCPGTEYGALITFAYQANKIVEGDTTVVITTTLTELEAAAGSAGVSCSGDGDCVVLTESENKAKLTADTEKLSLVLSKFEKSESVTAADLEGITVEGLVTTCKNLGVTCTESGGVWDCPGSTYGAIITFAQQALAKVEDSSVTITITSVEFNAAAAGAGVDCTSGTCGEVDVTAVEQQLSTDTTKIYAAFSKYTSSGVDSLTAADFEGITVEGLVQTCAQLGISCTESGGVWTCGDSQYGTIITFVSEALAKISGDATVTITITETEFTSAAASVGVSCDGTGGSCVKETQEESQAKLNSQTTKLFTAFNKFASDGTLTAADLEGITVDGLIVTCANLGVQCSESSTGVFTCDGSDFGYVITFAYEALQVISGSTTTITVTLEDFKLGASSGGVSCSDVGDLCQQTFEPISDDGESAQSRLITRIKIILKAFKKKKAGTYKLSDLNGISMEEIIAIIENLGVKVTETTTGDFECTRVINGQETHIGFGQVLTWAKQLLIGEDPQIDIQVAVDDTKNIGVICQEASGDDFICDGDQSDASEILDASVEILVAVKAVIDAGSANAPVPSSALQVLQVDNVVALLKTHFQVTCTVTAGGTTYSCDKSGFDVMLNALQQLQVDGTIPSDATVDAIVAALASVDVDCTETSTGFTCKMTVTTSA